MLMLTGCHVSTMVLLGKTPHFPSLSHVLHPRFLTYLCVWTVSLHPHVCTPLKRHTCLPWGLDRHSWSPLLAVPATKRFELTILRGWCVMVVTACITWDVLG